MTTKAAAQRTLSEFERAMILFQVAQNEQLHTIAEAISRDARGECERVQRQCADHIKRDCPLVVALMREVQS